MADDKEQPKPLGDWLTGKNVPYEPEYLSELDYWLGQ